MSGWFAMELPFLCIGTAALELDAAHVGQWMISRPIVIGPLLGWLCGAPAEGVSIGILMEMITLDDLPVGANVPLNATIAASSAVLLAAGPHAIAPAAAFPAGLVLGGLFSYVEARIRGLRTRLTRLAEAALDAGRPIPFRRLLATGIGWHAAAAAVFLYAGVSVFGPALSWAWEFWPGFIRQGIGLAFAAAQCLGWATVLVALRPR